MAAIWTPERVVSPELAEQLIAAQFPDLQQPLRIVALGAGFDNTAYAVNEEFVFRFPRRQLAAPLLETEIRLLPLLQGRLPCSVPDPCYVGRPTEGYPWAFAGYRRLPGRTACSAQWSAAQRAAWARPLGEFLKALHSVSAADAQACGANGDTLRRLDVPWRTEQTLARLDRIRDTIAPSLLAAIRRLMGDAPTDFQPRTTTLVHGDLYARHMLIDDGGGLAGVIDWGDVHLGDAAADFMAAQVLLPRETHAEFAAAYGPIAPSQWQAARLRAVFHSTAVWEYAVAVQDEDLQATARWALESVTQPA